MATRPPHPHATGAQAAEREAHHQGVARPEQVRWCCAALYASPFLTLHYLIVLYFVPRHSTQAPATHPQGG